MSEHNRELTQIELDKVRQETLLIEDNNRRGQELHVFAKEKAQLELDRLKNEVVRSEADTRNIMTMAKMNEMQYEQGRRAEEATLASDLFQHVYYFDTVIDQKNVAIAIDRLNYWHRTAPDCDIEMIFSSGGGHLWFGLMLFDHLRYLARHGHHITTGVLGMAASMASVLLQAGDLRYMTSESWIMVHEMTIGSGGKLSEVEDEAAFYKRMQERVANIYLDGIAHAQMNNTATKPMGRRKFLDSWARKDFWVSSNEALEYGLIDEVR